MVLRGLWENDQCTSKRKIRNTNKAYNREPTYKKWLSKQDKQILQFLKNINFQAVPGAFAIIPGPNGKIERVIFKSQKK